MQRQTLAPVTKNSISHIVPELSNKQLLLPIEIITKIYQYAVQIDRSTIQRIMKVDKHALYEMRVFKWCEFRFDMLSGIKLQKMIDFFEWSMENELCYDFNKFIKSVHINKLDRSFMNAINLITRHSPLHLDTFEFDDQESESENFLSSITAVRRMIIGDGFVNFLSDTTLESISEIKFNSNYSDILFDVLNKCRNMKRLSICQSRYRGTSVKLAAKLQAFSLYTMEKVSIDYYFRLISQSSDSLVEFELEKICDVSFTKLNGLLNFPNLKILCITYGGINFSNLLNTVKQLKELYQLKMTYVFIDSLSSNEAEDLFSIALSGNLVDITINPRSGHDAKISRLGRDTALTKYTSRHRSLLKFTIDD